MFIGNIHPDGQELQRSGIVTCLSAGAQSRYSFLSINMPPFQGFPSIYYSTLIVSISFIILDVSVSATIIFW